MPFITIQIGKYKMMALIDTRSQKSFISLELATKCEVLLQIDRKNIDKKVIEIMSKTAIYGSLYNQQIIINNALISGIQNKINK